MSTARYTYGIGRRKSATARARLTSGKGIITINNQSIEDYFDSSSELINRVSRPLKLLEVNGKYSVSLLVRGGGDSGQADACKLSISNALASINDVNRGTLKKAGYLKRDPREKERKKYGLKSARKKEQYSKR